MSRAAPKSPTNPTHAAMVGRLRRVAGQVRGLQHMVETDAACVDVLTQISATAGALEDRSREVSGAVAGLIGA